MLINCLSLKITGGHGARGVGGGEGFEFDQGGTGRLNGSFFFGRFQRSKVSSFYSISVSFFEAKKLISLVR